MATDLVLQDRDGSAVGGTGGYIVANNSFLLPPPSLPCKPLPSANSLACPGACYRTVLFEYPDSTPLPVGRKWGPGDLRYARGVLPLLLLLLVLMPFAPDWLSSCDPS